MTTGDAWCQCSPPDSHKWIRVFVTCKTDNTPSLLTLYTKLKSFRHNFDGVLTNQCIIESTTFTEYLLSDQFAFAFRHNAYPRKVHLPGASDQDRLVFFSHDDVTTVFKIVLVNRKSQWFWSETECLCLFFIRQYISKQTIILNYLH